MDANIAQALADARCDQDFIEQYEQLEREGKHEESLRLLRCQRCRLVDAMHEAQRPIDVIDLVIAGHLGH
jgi:hypothetical protein